MRQINPKTAILNFGSLNLDCVYQVPHIVRPGETLAARTANTFAGGKGLNQSIALARAGANVCHAGKIGADGKLLRDTLAQHHVGLDSLYEDAEASGRAIIQIEDQSGQNAIILEPGANFRLTRAEINLALDQFSPGEWLLLQNEINDIPFIMEAAHRRRFHIAINTAPCDERVRDYPLELADIIFANECEAATLSGVESPEQAAAILARRYPRTEFILTLGSAGALYAGPDGWQHQSALQVPVVDTTAAGDCFIGFYLGSMLAGNPPSQCLIHATRAAAIAIGRPGAAVSIPAAEEVFGR